MDHPSGSPRHDSLSIQIAVTNTQRYLAIDPNWIQNHVIQALRYLEIEAMDLSIALVDNATIRPINAQHLGHDWATDVVTFDLGSDQNKRLVGEIVVSVEMACNQAVLRGVRPLDELMLYLVHGLLHLCGYDDQSDKDVTAIRRREGEVLEALGLTNPFPQAELVQSRSEQSGEETLSWPR